MLPKMGLCSPKGDQAQDIDVPTFGHLEDCHKPRVAMNNLAIRKQTTVDVVTHPLAAVSCVSRRGGQRSPIFSQRWVYAAPRGTKLKTETS